MVIRNMKAFTAIARQNKAYAREIEIYQQLTTDIQSKADLGR